MILGKSLYRHSFSPLGIFSFIKKALFLSWSTLSGKRNRNKLKFQYGAPVLTVKEEGGLRCTSCMLCQELCPSFCISIEKEHQGEEEVAPLNFDINILKCTFCGICEDVCPVDAIRMQGPMPKANHAEAIWLWDINYLSSYAGKVVSEVGEERPLLPN